MPTSSVDWTTRVCPLHILVFPSDVHVLTVFVQRRPGTPTPSSENTARSVWLQMVCTLSQLLQDAFLRCLPVDGAGAVPAAKRPNVQMPDEYLPPNKILFLQNLPETVTKDQLMALFSQYVVAASLHRLLAFIAFSPQIPKPVRSSSHPNKEGHCIRGVPGRAECYGSEGCASQLQAGWGEQNQGMPPHVRFKYLPLTDLYRRSHSQGSSVPARELLLFVCCHTCGTPRLLTVPSLYSGARAQCIICATIRTGSPLNRRR